MAKFTCSIVVVMAIMATTASALTCYSCNSKDSVACKWGLTSFTYNTEECGSIGILDSIGAGAKCYKITAKNHQGDEYVARGCQSAPAFGCNAIASTIGWVSGQSSSDPNAVSDISCETCDKEKCNSAPKITGFTLLGLLLAAFAFLF
ncbi:uncharacterized protein LOC126740803 [Anthonomus grandis grandis]|uniref:uncharacterized protein LOC126740803 n=1 Tax=Anthonomus grandis grandis TaxID=2921223 RepID=UPI002165B40D|nr:uncharacterized protein LOC126740803 [Anthonomus grandis grandis]